MEVRPLRELTQYRERQKPPLSLRQLGRKIGVSGATVHRWETGTRRPGRIHAPQIADLIGMPVLEVMGIGEPAE